MSTIVAKKYFNSRLNGCLIRCLNVSSSGKVIVVAENGETKEFFVKGSDLGHSPDILDYGADAILCNIQNDKSIELSK